MSDGTYNSSEQIDNKIGKREPFDVFHAWVKIKGGDNVSGGYWNITTLIFSSAWFKKKGTQE